MRNSFNEITQMPLDIILLSFENIQKDILREIY